MTARAHDSSVTRRHTGALSQTFNNNNNNNEEEEEEPIVILSFFISLFSPLVLYTLGYKNKSKPVKQQRSSDATLSQAISTELEDGNDRAAVRLLMSADSPAEPSPESLSALGEKHPPASSNE